MYYRNGEQLLIGSNMDLKQLKYKEIKKYRDKILVEQNGVCPLTGIKIPEGKAVLDHLHAGRKDEVGENGAGLVRGVLDCRANSFEGKILYWYKRLGISKLIDLPTFLNNLALYLEKEKYPLIHPTEAPKPKKLSKVCYNNLVKISNQKIPPYPTSKKLTKKLEKLFNKYGIEIIYRR